MNWKSPLESVVAVSPLLHSTRTPGMGAPCSSWMRPVSTAMPLVVVKLKPYSSMAFPARSLPFTLRWNNAAGSRSSLTCMLSVVPFQTMLPSTPDTFTVAVSMASEKTMVIRGRSGAPSSFGELDTTVGGEVDGEVARRWRCCPRHPRPSR